MSVVEERKAELIEILHELSTNLQRHTNPELRAVGLLLAEVVTALRENYVGALLDTWVLPADTTAEQFLKRIQGLALQAQPLKDAQVALMNVVLATLVLSVMTGHLQEMADLNSKFGLWTMRRRHDT